MRKILYRRIRCQVRSRGDQFLSKSSKLYQVWSVSTNMRTILSGTKRFHPNTSYLPPKVKKSLILYLINFKDRNKKFLWWTSKCNRGAVPVLQIQVSRNKKYKKCERKKHTKVGFSNTFMFKSCRRYDRLDGWLSNKDVNVYGTMSFICAKTVLSVFTCYWFSIIARNPSLFQLPALFFFLMQQLQLFYFLIQLCNGFKQVSIHKNDYVKNNYMVSTRVWYV